MNLELAGRVALLTGGAGSIGKAVARAFSDEGAVPVIADLSARLEAISDTETEAMDVTDAGSVRKAVQAVAGRCGGIDILVTLAGVYQAGPVAQIQPDDWDRLMAINLKGTFLAAREVLSHMADRDFGRIISIASLAGQVGGVVAGAHYSASKAGVLSLVKSLAKQVPHPGITVNAVSPGPVEGDMTGGWSEEERRRMKANIPAGRFATAGEIADIVLFLSSSRAAYIHGAHLDINGGAYMD